MLPEFGGNSGYSDNFMVNRNTGVITYLNTSSGWLTAGSIYQLQLSHRYCYRQCLCFF
ncbi:hypothetical protein [Sodalis-like endosymbiont of Proechinophthirus fluctus]|uniref:hypothetical protein n=1 Tax=Sodalis-like endosymbiont of Proechinophthirus fluctus TaxID=1462730 RepID=UPI000ADD12C8